MSKVVNSKLSTVAILLFFLLLTAELLVPSFVSAYVDVNILLVGFFGYVIFLMVINRTPKEENLIVGKK